MRSAVQRMMSRLRLSSPVGGPTGHLVGTAASAMGIAGLLVSPAFGDVYRTPDPLGPILWDAVGVGTSFSVCIATNGDRCVGDMVTVTEGGGCSSGGLSIAVGDRGDGCGTYWYGREATGNIAAGLLGAESAGMLAVSDTGDSTGVGGADSMAVSGTGCARAGWVAVSVTGCADGGVPSGPFFGIETLPSVAVSGANRASNGRPNGMTAAPLGQASGGAVAVAGTGATSSGGLGAFTVGGNSNANGGLLSFSGTGHARGGTVNYGGSGAG